MQESERFWSKVNKAGLDECWVWTGGKFSSGYGQFNLSGRPSRKAYAHRYALLGRQKSDQLVLHKCDNKPCVNPNHLYLGTQKQNINDMYERGRNIFGTAHKNSKLDPEKIVKIRQEYKNGRPVRLIASELGTDESNVYSVLSGRTWAHVK